MKRIKRLLLTTIVLAALSACREVDPCLEIYAFYFIDNQTDTCIRVQWISPGINVSSPPHQSYSTTIPPHCCDTLRYLLGYSSSSNVEYEILQMSIYGTAGNLLYEQNPIKPAAWNKRSSMVGACPHINLTFVFTADSIQTPQ